MHKRHSISFYFFHDKTFPAENADTQFSLEMYAYAHSFRGTEESIFLRDDRTTELLQVHRDDLTGIRSGKTHFLFSLSGIRKSGHEQTFTGQYSFTGTHQFAQK